MAVTALTWAKVALLYSLLGPPFTFTPYSRLVFQGCHVQTLPNWMNNRVSSAVISSTFQLLLCHTPNSEGDRFSFFLSQISCIYLFIYLSIFFFFLSLWHFGQTQAFADSYFGSWQRRHWLSTGRLLSFIHFFYLERCCWMQVSLFSLEGGEVGGVGYGGGGSGEGQGWWGEGGQTRRMVEKGCREGVCEGVIRHVGKVWWTVSCSLCLSAVCVAVKCVSVCASGVIQQDILLTIRSTSILTFLHFLSLKTQPQAQWMHVHRS